ncbi:type III secretion protein [bacterium]|nr:type III secretion protein [bacterium]
MNYEHLNIGAYALEHIDWIWTFLLLAVRYGILMTVLPGFVVSPVGKMLRTPGILALALISTVSSPAAVLSDNMGVLLIQVISEALFGLTLGIIPLLIVSGVQMAGGLSSTTMGLGASQLVDPTMGGSLPSLGKLMGDLVILIFLLSNGHHAIIYSAAGLGGAIVPGTYTPDIGSVELVVSRVADVFRLGVLISAPVIVALLLTNFVMGLISKAIPQVNIFIVSFPLTIGIGLVLTGLSLPELSAFVQRELMDVESGLLVILNDVQTLPDN